MLVVVAVANGVLAYAVNGRHGGATPASIPSIGFVTRDGDFDRLPPARPFGHGDGFGPRDGFAPPP